MTICIYFDTFYTICSMRVISTKQIALLVFQYRYVNVSHSTLSNGTCSKLCHEFCSWNVVYNTLYNSNHTPPYNNHLSTLWLKLATKHALTTTIQTSFENNNKTPYNHPNTPWKQQNTPLQQVIQTPPDNNKPNFQHSHVGGFTFVLHNCTFY